jgi:hypothetical protein
MGKRITKYPFSNNHAKNMPAATSACLNLEDKTWENIPTEKVKLSDPAHN